MAGAAAENAAGARAGGAPGKGKAAGGKAAKKAPLGEADANARAGTGAPKGKRVEDVYQKLSQLEHILLRPDTYIGSVEKQIQAAWVLKDGGGEDGGGEDAPVRMEQREISFVPGLYKIFDEILVNACDHKVRDPKMDQLRVDIDPGSGAIRVYNNGQRGIPVEMHEVEGVYVPELIFGHLLTSSNYNDDEKKLTGGRNGYGAKLANVFSTEFVVETCDGGGSGRRYRQTFRNNMQDKDTPEISKCKASENWTCITFKPDLEKFGMESLEDDTVALMKRRVYDAAGCTGGLKVFLNGEKLPITKFEDYVNLYLGKPKDEGALPRVFDKTDRWQVCVSVSQGQFQQVSFVNSINTMKGGTHVNGVADQISKELLATKALKGHKSLKAFQVKNHLWVFVNSLIENPAFDSQTKETLTLKASSFGSKWTTSPDFMKKVGKCGVVDNILSWASFKQSKDLKKTDGAKRSRITGIPKLDDANNAGTRNSDKCTLILTEGDSAKALAVSGLSIVGRDNYGVYPLRGKLLNVRDANHTQIMNNAEIKAIQQIMGLQHGKKYTDIKSLRYGHIMIMTDQDHDGSHIKGLIINYLEHFFPTLLKIPGFLVEFITPIIKAQKGGVSKVFYTMPEYEEWREGLANQRGWSIKYYKGLGTSTAKEAKEYFAELDGHKKTFVYTCDEDGQLIDMAFSKKRVEDRKQWLMDFEPGTYLDHSVAEIQYSDFINKELVLFSRADLERSIPCVMDGFKPGQRKIMFCAFKRKLKSDIKVAQLAGYVSEHSAYHHGEQSLAMTIVGLAQDYVGSNNINVLHPSGQFGTRLQGGKDAASPRYIYTRLSTLTRKIFPEADDPLMSYLSEEGQSIEPEWYAPVLPLVLVNGADGIGTGWSTFIPNYSPKDVMANVRNFLRGEPMEPMTPWFKNFTGSIERTVSKGDKGEAFQISGCVEEEDECTFKISELPVRKWTQDYKEFLEGMIKPEKGEQLVTDYKEHHTDTTVSFTVKMTESGCRKAHSVGLNKFFKMTTSCTTSNMHLFNARGQITRYDTPQQIIREFCSERMGVYERRKAHILANEEAEMLRLSNKVRFILAVVGGKLVVSNRKKAAIVDDLSRQGFDMLPAKRAPIGATRGAEEAGEEAGEEAKSAPKVSFDYLLSLPIWNLTMEKVQELQTENDEKLRRVEALRLMEPADMWLDDLNALDTALGEREEEEARLAEEAATQVALAGTKKTAPRKRAAPKKMKKSEESDDEDWGPAVSKAKKTATSPKAKKWVPPIQSASAAEEAAAKPKAKPKAAKKKAAAPAKKKVSEDPFDSDDDDLGPSLMDRLAAGGKSKPVPAAAATQKPPARKPAAQKKAPPAKRKPAPQKVAKEAFDFPESDEEEPFSPAGPAEKKVCRPRPARTTSRKQQYVDSSDEESDEEDFDPVSEDSDSDGDWE